VDVLDSYIEEIKEDLKIDQFNLKEVALKLPGKKHHWVARLINHKRNLFRLEKEKAELKQAVIEELKEKAPVILSSVAIDKGVSEYQKIKDLNDAIQYEKLVIEFLEKAEKVFSSTSFDVGNIIKVMQLETL